MNFGILISGIGKRFLNAGYKIPKPVVVNYYNFSWRWDCAAFIGDVQQSQCDGLVIA